MKKVLVVIAILVAAAACGGAGSTVGGSAPKPANLSLGPQQSGGSTTGAPTKAGGTDTANPPVTDVVPAVQGPQVIRQAQLSISVASGSFDSKLAAVRAMVESEQGYIAGTDAQTNPASNDQIRTGVISFMVPAANFDNVIDQLSSVGKVQSEHITGNDVSAQYVDLQARLANEEAQRDAMLALLKEAKNISDIINVQNQIGQITQQIEQLKGQIAYFDHNTAFSTVTVTLTEAGAPVQPASSDSWGFATAVSDAAHNFVATVNYIVTGLGALGPILVLLGFGYLLWRRRGSPLPRRA
ncbi:MAG: DUF4349 domain-containing protein [Candidatus Dormiibacterota bacterium]